MNKTKEIENIRSLASGDNNAFKNLFLDYFPKIKYFISHLIKSDLIAEDLAQDIFIKIWENKESLTAINSFNSYVYRMAKNAVINHLKSQGFEKTYVAYITQKDENQASSEEDLFAKEIELLVRLTVEKMPPQRKKIYELSRIKGLKNEEIAKLLSLSKKTIENHLNLALKEIKKTILLFSMFFI